MDKAAVKLAPSILAADFARLGEQVAEAEQAGADRIHVDVMDGHFVANISMGAPIVASLRRVTRLHLETHLMISAPDFLLEECVEAEVRFVSRALGRQRQFAPHRTTHQGTGANGLGWSSTRPPRWRCLRRSCKMSTRCLVMTVKPGFWTSAISYPPPCPRSAASVR